MSDAELSELEKRTLEAERRLSALEGKMGNGALAVGGVDVQRYISELQGLKAVLLAAKSEQEALENRVQELETANSKLQYQVKHLKRAVQEADEKLAGRM